MTRKKLNGAIIGLGYWGPNIVRNLLKIPEVNITYAGDLSLVALSKFKEIYPFITTTNNINEILNNNNVDFISIATPLKSHFLIAKKALLSGKHVLVEKPMTSTSKEAEELIEIAKNKNKIIMVGHTFVYSEAVNEIKKQINKKTFGKILYFDSTRINLGRFRSDSNVIWDLASHDIAILNYLIKEKPLSIFALGSTFYSNQNSEIAHIFINYQNKITAHIEVSWLSPVKLRNILIGGTKKMIKYDDLEPSEKIRIYNKNVTMPVGEITPFSPAYRSGNITIPNLEIKEALFTELTHFIDCIKKKNKPITSGLEGLDTILLLEAAEKSLNTGKLINLN